MDPAHVYQDDGISGAEFERRAGLTALLAALRPRPAEERRARLWVLTEALAKTHRVTVGTFTWRGKTTPIAIRRHQGGLLLQRLYFADEVHNASEIDRGAEPKIRDEERTLAERLITELSSSKFQPENYEDEYRKRLLKAIEQKVAGEEIERVEVEVRPPTSDSRRASDGRSWRRHRRRTRGGARVGEAAGLPAVLRQNSIRWASG